MSYTIPNQVDAAFADQAAVDKVDLDIVTAADNGSGVVSGCAVTGTAAANGSLTVAAGVVNISGQPLNQQVTVAGNTVAITANSSGNPRYDLISVGLTGTAVATAGTAAAAPVFPAIPANSAIIAVYRVPNGHTTSTTIAANSTNIVDKRVFIPESPWQEGVANVTGADFSWTQKDWTKSFMEWKCRNFPGAPQTYNNVVWQVVDYLDAPILWLGGVGGLGLNDDIYTGYSVLGPYNFMADIYGFAKFGQQWTFTFGGPPGNLLTWNDAVHEVYNSTRAATVGFWGVVSNCTLSALYLASGGLPITESVTRLRGALRLTCTTNSSTVWISQPGGASATSGVVAGDVISVVAMIRANSAAAARNFNVRITWLTAGGIAVGADVNGPNASIPTQATTTFTPVLLENTIVPATATRFQLQILGATILVNEAYDIQGVAVLRNQQTAKFAPPFIAYNASGRTEGGSNAGDTWTRTDTPSVPGQRVYMCTTGGTPNNQSWAPLDTATILKLANDTATNSTTTMVSITQLAIPVLANTQYVMDFTVIFQSAVTTTGIQFGFTGPASPTSVLIVSETQLTDTTWQVATARAFGNLTASTGVTTININYLARIKLLLVNGANAGTVQIQFASEVAATAVLVKRGSMVSVS
jgi:hypothetical protein